MLYVTSIVFLSMQPFQTLNEIEILEVNNFWKQFGNYSNRDVLLIEILNVSFKVLLLDGANLILYICNTETKYAEK